MVLPGRDVSWKSFLRALRREWVRDSIGDVAGSLTFFAVLALFPFVLFLVSLASVLIDPRLAESLVRELSRVAPPQATEIIGYDASRKHYTMQSYDNQGNATAMQASVDGGQWTFNGNNVRFRGGFSEDGRMFSGVWEMRERLNVAWRSWMTVELRRTQDDAA